MPGSSESGTPPRADIAARGEELFDAPSNSGDDDSNHNTARTPISRREIDGRIAIRCRECGEMTPDLKLFFPPRVLFLVYYLQWEREAIEACPRCMRFRLLKEASIGLLTANILWPIVILVPSVYHLFLTYRPGHSARIRDLYWREFTEAKVITTGQRSDAAPQSEGRDA